MTLTINGINYCLQQFGDTGECCTSIDNPIIFDYTDNHGVSWMDNVASTGVVVNFIASNIITWIHVTSPLRIPIDNPKDVLDAANGATTEMFDGDIFAMHDENSTDPWCYPLSCSEHDGDQTACEAMPGCYWWSDGTCRATQEPDGEEWLKYIPYIIIGTGGVLILAALLSGRKKESYYQPSIKQRRNKK